MKTKEEIRNIVDEHAQKYFDSCSPSLAEMLLKLVDAVSLDYYDEQNRDQNEQVGLKNILGKVIAGKTFQKIIAKDGETLTEKVKSKLVEGKSVGIYLPIQKFHGFVIAGIEDNNVLLLTKHSEMGQGQGQVTEIRHIPLSAFDKMTHFDCISCEDALHKD